MREAASSTPAGAWWVYLVRCRDGTLYTGITTEPDRRLGQHNAGTASKYTRSRLPVVLIYRERSFTRGAALKRELEIKSLTRRAKELLVVEGRRAGKLAG